jgi:signal peptidase I
LTAHFYSGIEIAVPACGANRDRHRIGGYMLVPLLLALISLRIFVWQPFNVPSVAQTPTLRAGDYFFASKYAYGYSQYSFPFGLIRFNGRVLASEPKRGDVAVFKSPSDGQTDYVKRIVGLPGETILLRGGVVFINGVPVPRKRVEDYPSRDRGMPRSIPQYEETPPDGPTYRVLGGQPDSLLENCGPFTVPPGHYFMMGDYRDNSADSRLPGGIGYVPFENLIGRAEIIFNSVAEDGSSRPERLLTRIH